MLKVYIAGPDVFFPHSRLIGTALSNVCRSTGFEAFYPGNSCSPDPEELFRRCREGVEWCDAVVANLTPFRGPSADVGTVWEIGYAKGIGKRVVAYRHIGESRLEDRVVPDGNMVESFGLFDNLMVAYGVDYMSRYTGSQGFANCLTWLKDRPCPTD